MDFFLFLDARNLGYIEGLFDMLQKTADRKTFWHSAKAKTGLDTFFVKYEKHFLCFRELDGDTIGVISIIHELRNIVRVLEQDLARAAKSPKH